MTDKENNSMPGYNKYSIVMVQTDIQPQNQASKLHKVWLLGFQKEENKQCIDRSKADDTAIALWSQEDYRGNSRLSGV